MKEKIKVAVPEFVLKTLKEDQKHFDITKEKLCNEILLKFSRENLNCYCDIQFNKNEYLQFNLNKTNKIYYEELSKKIDGKNDSEKIRKIFSEYAVLQPFVRESILFWEKIICINSFEKNKKSLKVCTNGEIYEGKVEKIFIDEEKGYLMAKINKHNHYVSEIKILN
ncbi:hypothetical protein [Fusobacterium varium]|uniref:hypothetical protein n=1 Tax=Fusobacterium varium TaxID=856 RepID=UPI000BBAF93E|nr:hypothetical protein FV113G1_28300 [Fusobacterium varium]BBA52555.1 hypothetical protein FV113G1_29060 [Fusobacterium varium]